MNQLPPPSNHTTPADRAAFELPGTSPACVLLHGFMGDTREMRALAEAIHQQLGYHVAVPLWPGHGAPPWTLGGLSMADFMAAGRTALAAARAQHSQIVVIGFSMGGALAVQLIAERPSAGLIALAPMIAIRNPLQSFTQAAAVIRHVLPWAYPLKMRGGADSFSWRDIALGYFPDLDPADPLDLKRLQEEIRFPLSIADELGQMQRQARAAARNLHSPTLIISGDLDLALNPTGSQWLYDHIPAADKQLHWLPGAGHNVGHTINSGHNEMIATVISWLRERFS